MKLKIIVFFTAVITCLSPFAIAETNYARGLNAFKLGDYESALKNFSSALQEKPNSLKIHYNMGSSHYKLKQYHEAEKHFLTASQEPKLEALSHYNLGLIYARQKRLEKSKQHFLLAQDAGNAQIKSLAKKQINKMTPKQREKKLLSGKLSGYLNIKYNYDDNITNANEDLPVETLESDGYTSIIGNISYKHMIDKAISNTFKVGGYLSRYNEFDNYDQTQINLGFYHARSLHNMKSRIGVHGYRSKKDGTDHQQRIKYQLRGDFPYIKQHTLRTQYDYTRFSELDPAYLAQSGSRHKLKLENRSTLSDRFKIRLGYEFETNDRNDFRTSTSFISYSPDRHNFYAKLRFKPSASWKIRMNFEYRTSIYEGNVVNSLKLKDREDNRFRSTFAIAYKLNKHTAVETSYRYTDNDSNFASNIYTSNRVNLSLKLHYF